MWLYSLVSLQSNEQFCYDILEILFYRFFMFWFSLVWFYGISTVEVYLMPNPIYTYIRYKESVNISQQS